MDIPTEKTELHPRNKHRARYDFAALTAVFPTLKSFVTANKYGNDSIDFANPNAVKALNKAILMTDYGIQYWDIPPQYLCPPIPSRAEYIHQIADILSNYKADALPKGNKIRILDIGTGANGIYPIIGHQAYDWQFVASDIDEKSIQSVEKIVAANPDLQGAITCRLQTSTSAIFQNIIKPDEYFDCTLCNPPFHATLEEAIKGTQRKLRNLGNFDKTKKTKPVLNFGGQNTELWCEGGEIAFITNMITESAFFKTQCLWFSTLVSKGDNLPEIYTLLTKNRVFETKTITLNIGNKISRLVFWTYLNQKEQAERLHKHR